MEEDVICEVCGHSEEETNIEIEWCGCGEHCQDCGEARSCEWAMTD